MFDDYEEATAFVEEIGSYPALMAAGMEAVADLADGFFCIGFSNGGAMGEFVATQRRVQGVVMCSGALPLEMLGVDAWPNGVPAQIHYTVDDPFRNDGWIESVATAVAAANADIEVFDYPGAGHLFTDTTMTADYDPAAAELLWARVDKFCTEAAS